MKSILVRFCGMVASGLIVAASAVNMAVWLAARTSLV